MRILLLTRMDRLSGARIAEALIHAGESPVGIVAEQTLSLSPRALKTIQEAVRTHGILEILRKGRQMFVTRITLPFLRLFPPRGPFRTIQELLAVHPIPNLVTDDINHSEVLKFVREKEPDLLLIANTGVLGKPLLEMAPKGCLNLHLSLLPKYRGLDSVFWALSRGEQEIGVTVHWVDDKIDHGPILLQKPIPVQRRETIEALTERAVAEGASLVVEAVQKIASGQAKPTAQDEMKASYFSRFPLEERKKFRYALSGKIRVVHIITRLDRGGSSENTLLTLL
ncbi:MAG: formyltransferase family protein, partial [Candidatus Omnitrophota bacterium]